MNDNRIYKSEVFAKINLSLEIVGKVGNLHTLKMLVCPYKGFSDVVEFCPTDNADKTGITDICINATFDGFERDRFLDFYMPKVQKIAKELGIGGRLSVRKGVPLGAGLGGSSASVVGALKAMLAYAETLGKSAKLDDGFLLSLGSDVPCMLYGKTCFVGGVGEIVKPVDIDLDLSAFSIEIAKGGSDTKACYDLYDKLKAENPNIDTSLCLGLERADVEKGALIEADGDVICLYRNDLTLPATMLNKNIQNLIFGFNKCDKFSFMTGSGSAVVFKTHKL